MDLATGVAALRLLREHLAAGNLTADDFDRRRRTVLDALTGTKYPEEEPSGDAGQEMWHPDRDEPCQFENLGTTGVANDHHINYEYTKARLPKGHLKVVDRLLPATQDPRMVIEGSSGEIYDWEIFHAASNNNTKRMEELLEYGISVDARDPESGNTPLMMAASRAQRQAMMWLVERGCNVNLRNRMGMTALHMLVQAKQAILAVWLVRQGADPTLEDSRQFSSIDIALPWMQSELKEAWDDYRLSQARKNAPSSFPPAAAAAAAAATAAPIAPLLAPPDGSAASIPVHHPAGLPPMAEPKAEPSATKTLRVYLKNNAYKTVMINDLTKAGDLCRIMAEKLGGEQFAMSLEVIDCIKLNERRLDPAANLFRIMGGWPTIISTAEEPPLESTCRLKVVPIRGASDAAQTWYRSAMYGK